MSERAPFPEINGDIVDLEEENIRLRSLLEDLVRAVEPFAEFSECYPASEHAGDIVVDWARREDNSIAQLIVGDLRRAREAYLKAHSHTEKETG